MVDSKSSAEALKGLQHLSLLFQTVKNIRVQAVLLLH